MATLAKKLSREDQSFSPETQKYCPISGARLGDPQMGVPVKVLIKGQPIFLCCVRFAKGGPATRQDRTLSKDQRTESESARRKARA